MSNYGETGDVYMDSATIPEPELCEHRRPIQRGCALCRDGTDTRRRMFIHPRLAAAAPDLRQALQDIVACASVRIDDPRAEVWRRARALLASLNDIPE